MPSGSAAMSYADQLIREWAIPEQSPILASVRRVLNEMIAEAQLSLRDRRLEVMVLPKSTPGVWDSVWAFFPVHRRRRIAQILRPRPETRVLLVISTASAEWEPPEAFEVYLRDHLGHVLLYLRDPKATNECTDAEREWLRNVQQGLTLGSSKRAPGVKKAAVARWKDEPKGE